jgi:hypothetical protein
MKNEEDLKEIFPLNPENDDLFHSMETGIVLSSLLRTLSISEHSTNKRA